MGTELVVIAQPPAPKKSKSSNPYRVLGVKRSATADQITSAYKKLANKAHPDRGGDPLDFKRIQRAYDVLSDVSRRRQFDLDGFVATAASDPALPGAAQMLIAASFNGFFGAMEQAYFEGMEDKRAQKHKFLTMQMNDPINILMQKFAQDIKSFRADIKALRRVHNQLRKWARAVRHSEEDGGMYKKVYDARVRQCVNKLQHAHQQLQLHRVARRLTQSYAFTTKVDSIGKKLQKMEREEQLRKREEAKISSLARYYYASTGTR